jgi:hypothetical protein
MNTGQKIVVVSGSRISPPSLDSLDQTFAELEFVEVEGAGGLTGGSALSSRFSPICPSSIATASVESMITRNLEQHDSHISSMMHAA